MYHPRATAEEISRRNRENYDQTTGPIWERVVFETVNGGRAFINMGGSPLLGQMAEAARLKPGAEVLELGSGQGEVALELAERFGCEVDGLDLNAWQVGQALARRSSAPPEIARRVRFFEGDAGQWGPLRRYDAVLAVDSLMLMPDPAAVLARAREALRPGGAFVAATIAAGPRLDDGLRQFAWESDGMISLLGAGEYESLLQDSGFGQVEVRDLTPLAVDWARRMADAIALHREEIVRHQGEESFRSWRDGGQRFLGGYVEGGLTYLLVIGRNAARP